MKTLLAGAWVFAWLVLLTASGCGDNPPPRPCAPNDTSCLPCPDPRTTNPACQPWILDAKKQQKKEPTR